MTRDLSIVELDAEDPAAVDAAFTIGNDAVAADLPDWPPNCRYEHDARLRHPYPASRRLQYLAYRGGEAVGLVQLELPVHDNLDKGHVDVLVPAAHRRQGVGRALYAHAVQTLLSLGRTSVLGCSVISDASGAPKGTSEHFALKLGQENRMSDVRRRLDLATVNDAELDRLLAEGWAKAAGYSVVQWRDEAPEEYIDDIAELDSSFIDESPTGELDYEAEKVDAERLRKGRKAQLLYGRRLYETGMVDDSTGRLVAWTALRLARTVDWHAWQLITLVHPKHRGHRLGMVAKVINLRSMLAQEPAVRVVDTFNAEVNSHMIAINEAMGFRAVDRWANWQQSVA